VQIHKDVFLLDFGLKKSCSNLRRAEKTKSREVALGSLITKLLRIRDGALCQGDPSSIPGPLNPPASSDLLCARFRENIRLAVCHKQFSNPLQLESAAVKCDKPIQGRKGAIRGRVSGSGGSVPAACSEGLPWMLSSKWGTAVGRETLGGCTAVVGNLSRRFTWWVAPSEFSALRSLQAVEIAPFLPFPSLLPLPHPP